MYPLVRRDSRFTGAIVPKSILRPFASRQKAEFDLQAPV